MQAHEEQAENLLGPDGWVNPSESSFYEKLKTYLARHWTGELPLGQSFWVNTIAFNALLMVIRHFINVGWEEGSVQSSQLQLATVYFQVFLLAPWQIVGLWRSAKRVIQEKQQILLPRIVQMGCLASGVLVIWISLYLPVLTGMALRDGLYSYTITLHQYEEGNEIVANGFISAGIADEFKRELDVAPPVALVTLNLSGGLVEGAEKMGELILSRGLNTATVTLCESACILAFIAGQHRILKSGAHLGFHRSQWLGLDLLGKNTDAANRQVERIMKTRGIAVTFIEKALATPSNKMWRPTVEELKAARVITRTID
jgi:hypothetical protein